MDDPLSRSTLTLAGRPVEDAWNRIRRYCGLTWSGGAPETWAYRYYDQVETDSTRVTQVDVLCAAALHAGLSKGDLAFFWDHTHELADWLELLPHDLVLCDADDAILEHLGRLSDWPGAPSVTLLSKVLHRKRPDLVPLIDRHFLDWYRPVTGARTAAAAWPALLAALRKDLGGTREGLGRANALLIASMRGDLEEELPRPPTALRMVDIAIWMGGSH